MKVTIERVANGWVVSRHEGDAVDTFVSGDDETLEQPDAESLCRVLWEVFGHHYQSKHRAGITVEYVDYGKEREHEDRCCYIPNTATRGSD